MLLILIILLIIVIVLNTRYGGYESFVSDYYGLNWTDPMLTERVNEEKTLSFVRSSKENNTHGKNNTKDYLSYSMSCDYTDNAMPQCVMNHDMTHTQNPHTGSY